jgi:zinc protease
MTRLGAKFLILLFLAIGFFGKAFGGGFIPHYEQATLPNGLTIIMVEDHKQPMVRFAALIKTGSVTLTADQAGLANFTAILARQGTINYPSQKLTAAIDSVGATILVMSSFKDGLVIRGECLSRYLGHTLTIFSDILIRPAFTDEGIERLKRRFLSASMQTESAPEWGLKDILYRTYFGDEGYGLPNLGTPASIKKISRAGIVKFHQDNFRPNNTVIIMAGDFKIETARKLIAKHFSDWSPGSGFPPPRLAVTFPDSLRILLIDFPSAPSVDFAIGQPGAPVGSEDYPALVLLNYILGESGSVSRLSRNLVRDNGLATYVYSRIDWSRGNGLLWIYGSSPTDNVPEALHQLISVLSDIRTIRISVKELDEAKFFFRGFMPGLYETDQTIIDRFSTALGSGVGVDYQEKLLSDLDKVDPGRLRAVAEKYLDPKRMTIVIQGSAASLKNQLSEIAPVEVINSGQD